MFRYERFFSMLEICTERALPVGAKSCVNKPKIICPFSIEQMKREERNCYSHEQFNRLLDSDELRGTWCSFIADHSSSISDVKIIQSSSSIWKFAHEWVREDFQWFHVASLKGIWPRIGAVELVQRCEISISIWFGKRLNSGDKEEIENEWICIFNHFFWKETFFKLIDLDIRGEKNQIDWATDHQLTFALLLSIISKLSVKDLQEKRGWLFTLMEQRMYSTTSEMFLFFIEETSLWIRHLWQHRIPKLGLRNSHQCRCLRTISIERFGQSDVCALSDDGNEYSLTREIYLSWIHLEWWFELKRNIDMSSMRKEKFIEMSLHWIYRKRIEILEILSMSLKDPLVHRTIFVVVQHWLVKLFTPLKVLPKVRFGYCQRCHRIHLQKSNFMPNVQPSLLIEIESFPPRTNTSLSSSETTSFLSSLSKECSSPNGWNASTSLHHSFPWISNSFVWRLWFSHTNARWITNIAWWKYGSMTPHAHE